MSFFNSEFVQEELKEISTLQEEIYEKMYAFSDMNKEDKMLLLKRVRVKKKIELRIRQLKFGLTPQHCSRSSPRITNISGLNKGRETMEDTSEM